MVFSVRTMKRLLFGNDEEILKIEIAPDSKPLLQTISLANRIKSVNISGLVEGLKEMIKEEKIKDILYIQTKDNVADIMTKYQQESQEFNIFFQGIFEKMEKQSRDAEFRN